jgi:glycosyltransferase involved in cell wall biosynthesis
MDPAPLIPPTAFVKLACVDLSIIIPVYEEAENLPDLFSEIDAILPRLPQKTEIILVDDGSKDDSFQFLKAQAEKDPRYVAVGFRANFGQTAAIQAGIRESRGAVLVLMDADLQNDPADIPRLLEQINAGADCVSGWRRNRRDAALTRVLPSKIANGLIGWVTGMKLHDFGCTLKAYRREFLADVSLYGEMHRFIPFYAKLEGARIEEIVVNHRPRTRGVSKYGIIRTLKVMIDLLTVKFMGSYFAKPAYMFGGLGMVMEGLAGLGFVTVLYYRLHLHIYVKDQPLFILSAFFALIGLQFIVTGLLAEVLVRTYFAAARAPYRIREVVRNRGAGGTP